MVLDLTGESTFTNRIAVARLRGISTALDREKEPTINANLRGCSFGFLTLQDMWELMLDNLATEPAGSEIGRLAQLLKAAGLRPRRWSRRCRRMQSCGGARGFVMRFGKRPMNQGRLKPAP
jgi:hypothetical protein